MKIAKDSFNLVIAGKWNRYILNPGWVASKLFEIEKIDVEFSMDLDAPPRYKANSILFVPESKKVLITATDITVEVMNNIQTIAKRLVNILQHTPYQAIGFNYGYIINDHTEKESLINLFDFNDITKYTGDGWNKKNFIINRAFGKEDYTLNLYFTLLENGDIILHINFNYLLNDFKKIIEVIDKNSFIENYESTLNLLENYYNLKLEENE